MSISFAAEDKVAELLDLFKVSLGRRNRGKMRRECRRGFGKSVG